MTHGGFVRAAAALALAGLMLVGCAPTSSAPSASPTKEPTIPPTAAPTPTPTAAAAPSVRVPVECANLFTPARASALLGVTATAQVDEKTEPTDLDDAGRLQRGILTCTWGGNDKTDSGYDQELSIWVDADGVTDFPANRAWFSTRIMDSPTKNAFGEQSESGCTGGGGFYCFADVLVGEYWVTVLFRDLNADHTIPKTTALSRLQQIARTVVPALRSAGAPAAAWTPPTVADNGFCEKKNNVVDVRKALASPGLDYDSDPADTGSEVNYLADQSGPLDYCAWYQLGATPKGQTSAAGVTLLQGGAWVIQQFVADPPTQWYVGKFSAVDVPGSTGALLACNSADCLAVVGVGANAAAISFDDRGNARNLASITAMVAVLAKS